MARTLGIGMRIAGWGGFLLSILVWFSLFPPSGNPVIGEEHMAFAFSLLLLMFLHAGNRFGLGRWLEAHTRRCCTEQCDHDQTAPNLQGRNSQILTVASCPNARYRSAREANHHPAHR